MTAELVRSALLIGVGVFATTLAQPSVIKLPLQNLLKTDLHIRPEGMAVFFAVSALAWYFKPLAGLLSDSVPLFGTRRRHYLLVSAAAATLLRQPPVDGRGHARHARHGQHRRGRPHGRGRAALRSDGAPDVGPLLRDERVHPARGPS